MTDKNPEYDVYLRTKNLTEVPDPVRVVGKPRWDDLGYLSFIAETEDPYSVTVTAAFPNLKVSRVVLSADENSEFRRGFLVGYENGYQNGLVQGPTGPGEPETES